MLFGHVGKIAARSGCEYHHHSCCRHQVQTINIFNVRRWFQEIRIMILQSQKGKALFTATVNMHHWEKHSFPQRCWHCHSQKCLPDWVQLFPFDSVISAIHFHCESIPFLPCPTPYTSVGWFVVEIPASHDNWLGVAVTLRSVGKIPDLFRRYTYHDSIASCAGNLYFKSLETW